MGKIIRVLVHVIAIPGLFRPAMAAAIVAKIVKGAQLKVYKGGSHGLAQTDPDTFNKDLLAFVRP